MGNQNQNANRSNFFLKTYRNWRYFIIVKNRPTVNTGSFFTLQFLLSSCGDSLAIEFVRFLHRWRSLPCCVLESRVVLFTTLFFTLRFLLSSCGVHLQSSLSDFYIVGGAHHAACQRAALFYLQLFSLPFGFFFRFVVFTCKRVCQIFTSSEEPTIYAACQRAALFYSLVVVLDESLPPNHLKEQN